MLFYSLTIALAAAGLAGTLITRDITVRLRAFPGWAC